MINGSVGGGAPQMQNLSLTVSGGSSGSPTFAINVSNPSLTVNPNDSAVFNGTLTASGGYGSPVSLRCLGAVPLICRLSPATLTPTPAGAAFTVTASNDAQNHFKLTIDATGTDGAHIHQSTPVELIVGFNFAINNNSASQTVAAGQSATYNLDVVPLGNPSVFPGNVTLSCSGLGMPALTTCAFTPSQVASGEGDTNVLLKVETTAASPSANLGGGPPLPWHDFGLALTGLVLAWGGVTKSRGRRKKAKRRLAILCALLGLLVACGGGTSGGSGGNGGGVGAGHPGTTPGNYTITVTGAVGSVTRTADVVLVVK